MSSKPSLPSCSFKLSPARAPAPVDEVPSPCINICRMHEATGLCEGCWRNIDEIALWSQLAADDKRSVLALTAARRADPSQQPDPFGP
jgi:uncharacterized protein